MPETLRHFGPQLRGADQNYGPTRFHEEDWTMGVKLMLEADSSFLMRVFCLGHKLECLPGKPGPPIQFREYNDQREHEDLRHEKIPSQIGKDRSILKLGYMRDLPRCDYPETIDQEPTY